MNEHPDHLTAAARAHTVKWVDVVVLLLLLLALGLGAAAGLRSRVEHVVGDPRHQIHGLLEPNERLVCRR
jgi:hypothetical protein